MLYPILGPQQTQRLVESSCTWRKNQTGMGKTLSNLLKVTLLSRETTQVPEVPIATILWFCSSGCGANGQGALCCSLERLKEEALSSSVVAWGSQVKHFLVAVRPVLGASLSLLVLSCWWGSWMWRDLQSWQGASWVKQVRKDSASVTKGKPLNHPYVWANCLLCTIGKDCVPLCPILIVFDGLWQILGYFLN